VPGNIILSGNELWEYYVYFFPGNVGMCLLCKKNLEMIQANVILSCNIGKNYFVYLLSW